MIWFSCSQCGKALSRSASSAGAFIFCTCGQGNVVPWDSTIAAPPEPPPAAAVPPQPPPLRPVPMGDEKIPVARRPAESPPRPRDLDEPRARPSSALPVRNPGRCFNHQDQPILEKCEDCSEGFCADCLVRFQGRVRCGPCKNFRLRATDKAGTVSNKALIAVLLAMAAGPGVACLWPFGASGAVMLLSVLALFAQLAAFVLGGLALRETEANPRLSGRSLAITGMLTAGLASGLTVCFVIFGPR